MHPRSLLRSRQPRPRSRLHNHRLLTSLPSARCRLHTASAVLHPLCLKSGRASNVCHLSPSHRRVFNLPFIVSEFSFALTPLTLSEKMAYGLSLPTARPAHPSGCVRRRGERLLTSPLTMIPEMFSFLVSLLIISRYPLFYVSSTIYACLD